jgi:hypothetical protein
MTKWHKITKGESDESYPGSCVLIAVFNADSNKNEVHVGFYYRQYEEEASDICVDNDFTDYNELDGTYYTPKGWYQEVASDEYSGIYTEDVVAWAELPKYEGEK